MPLLTIAKLDHAGHERLTYQGETVYADADVIVARCVWQAIKPFSVGPFTLENGDLFIEHYFREQYFNIMCVYSPVGLLKGAYCNISALAEIAPDRICWRDWFLDLLVLPDGATIELDRDEFEASAPDAAMRSQAETALDTLQQWLAQGRWPLDMPGACS
jgi:predicted RNA-binding protein associated with RNAse of E/G family